MLTIVWDVDDVLNDLMYQWFTSGWRVERPECMVEYSDLVENPPHVILGVEKQTYLASLDVFRCSSQGINLTPNPQVLEWFREHGARFRHIALTARPLETAPDVAHWVMKHFGTWIRCFGIVPSRDIAGVPKYDTGKGDFLRWIGAGDVLVDDTVENLNQAKAAGLQTIAFPQPWNRSTETVASVLNQLAVLEEVS